jgi:hypothetical protein
MPDIDLDFADRDQVLKLIKHIPASQIQNNQLKKHNSGVYFTDIPRDPITGFANIDYITAEQRGYFKIDFLNMSVYKLVRDRQHYQQLLDQEPTWYKLWQEPKWASQLVHIGNYCDLLDSMRPDSVTRMAAFISIIRPGKAHLQNLPWDKVFQSVWDGDDSQGFIFKKSHALSYSKLVTLHMNLLNQDSEIY